LEPDDVILVDAHTYHREILKAYIEQVGVMPLANAAADEATQATGLYEPSEDLLQVLDATRPTEAISKLQFLHNQWTTLMGRVTTASASELFHVAKVVISWLILEDPRHALELFASSLNILEAMDGSGNNTEASDCLHVLVASVLSMIITHASVARIINDIDDHRLAGPIHNRTIDNAVLRYALGGLSDQLLSLLPA
jgi:hypothetical protein